MAEPSDLDRRAHELLVQAIDLSAGQRAEFVSRSCSDDPGLERYVLELLDAAGRAESFLDAPALESAWSDDLDAVGTYLVLGVLGRGGMATVYEAEQKEPRRRVALKVLRGRMTGRDALLRFRFETEALAKLRHPGIAQIYEAGTTKVEGGTPILFFAMELVPSARTLRQYAVEENLPFEKCVRLIAEVCDAMHHGHQNGIIHRDLKPGNVLVGPDGRPKLIDFGVAKFLAGDLDSPTELHGQSAIIGTLNYMSPEQSAASPDVDIRSDVYSLGVMLYELVTRRLPHDLDGVSIPAALRRIIEDPPQPPKLPATTFHRDLSAIIAKAMEKQPERRYDGASALAADLRRLLAHEAILASPPGIARGIWLFARRHRALVSVVAASLLLVTWLSVGFALRLSNEVEARRHAEAVMSAERDNALWEAYVANIGGAQSSISAGEYAQATARLEATASKVGTWEHGLLSRMAQRSVSTLHAPGGMILDLATHPSRPDFVTCDDKGNVSLWDGSIQMPIASVCLSDKARAFAVSFDAEGDRVIVGMSDGCVHVRDAKNLAELSKPIIGRRSVRDISTLPDGRVAIANGSSEPVWLKDDPAAGFPSPQPDGIDAMAVSPDGRWFATANDAGEVWVRDASSLKPVVRMEFPGGLNQIRFDEKGTRLAGVGASSHVLVWSIPSGEILHDLEPATRATTVRSLAFSSDAGLLAVGLTHRGIVVFDLQTGEQLGDYKGHTDAVSAVLFRDGDRELLSSSWDRTLRTWRLTELAHPGGITRLEVNDNYVHAVRFSSGGASLISGSNDRTLRLWNPDRAQETQEPVTIGSSVIAIDIVPDDSNVIFTCSDGTVRALDRASGSIRTFEPRLPRFAQTLAIDPVGGRVAVGAEDGSVTIWDLRTGEQVRRWTAHNARVNGIAFSPDGMHLATASRDKTVGLWNAKTGERKTLEGRHESDVFDVAFSSNSSVLYSGSRDQTIGVWDVRSGKHLRSLAGHGQFVTCLAISPDGSRLAAGSWFGEVILFDTRTGSQLLSLSAHDAAIRDIDFSPDGRWIATASNDGTVWLADSWSRERADKARSAAGPDTDAACPPP